MSFVKKVNFLSFDAKEEAEFFYYLVTSAPALEFLDSMVFWDEKRPITNRILRKLSLIEIAKELGEIEQYQWWAGNNKQMFSDDQLSDNRRVW